jgi:Helix-turn-helix domain
MNELKAGQPFQPSMLLEGILVPEALLKDPTLSSSARLLWGILADYQGTSSECFPVEETLAVFLSVQVRQLQTYLKELANYTRGDPPEAVPLLAVKRVWVEKDQKTRNCYTLLWQPFLGVDLKEAGTKRTHRANGGNAQSVAHRSGENTQNMHPVPPGIPGEDDGVVGAGISRSDRQSSARRSVDDLQDPASGWPAIPAKTAAPYRTVGHQAIRNILRISPGATRKIPLRSDLAFPVTTTAPLRSVGHQAMRNILRIGPRATRQILPLSDRPFPVTTMAPRRTMGHRAICNILHISPRATRQILRGLPSSVETPARYRTPCSPALRACTS